MSRISSICCTAVAAFGLTFAVLPADAKELRMSSQWTETTAGAKVDKWWASEIAKRTNGEVGEIVTRVGDATQFLGYWSDPDKTADLRLGPWLRTRDLALRDDDGYFWYRGHEAVAEAAVVASPDPERGAIVKAFIRLAAGIAGTDELTAELQAHVKSRLAAYKYPREIEYVTDIETTSSGKLNRKRLRELERQRKGRA